MSDAGGNSTQACEALARTVWDRCEALAACTDEPGGITRLCFGAGMRQAHDRMREWMTSAGLSCRVDAAGNLIGRRAAALPNAPILLIGSHLDSVPNAGKYDGPLGVLLALAAVEALSGQPLPFHVDVVAFSDEEGSRFHTAYLGSSAMAGRFDATWLDRVDAAGLTMREAMAIFGLDPAQIPDAAYDPAQVLGYVEAHIEQGVVLERESRGLGAVSAIAGQNRMRLTFTGEARHAGTTPMELRKDALIAAAKMIVTVRDDAMATPGLRATVGQIECTPNATNVVPGRVRISLDIRHADDAERERAVSAQLAAAQNIAASHDMPLEVLHDMAQPAVPMDRVMTELLCEAISVVESTGAVPRRIVSGAGHDGVALASLCPVAMLFLRNPGGISHHPDEAVLPQDIAAAIAVLTDFIARLARSGR